MRYTGVATLLLSLFLSGCAAQTGTPHADAADIGDPPPPVTYTPGELNRESLFELLAAEIAGQRRQFDTALGYYLHQARMSGDPAIAERATRIAQFLRDSDAVLDATAIWSEADPQALEPLHIQTNILIAEGRYEEALPILRRVLAEDSVEAVLLIGSHSQQLSPESARVYDELLAEVSEAQPDRLDLLLTRALLKRRMGDDAGALVLLNQGLAIEPEQADLALQKIEILRQQGAIEAALHSVRAALKANPEHKQLRIQQAQLLVGTQPQAALRQIQRLILDYPDDTQLHYYFALLLLDNDRFSDSRELLSALLEQNPDNSNLHFYLALAEESLGNDESALRHYMEVSEGPNLEQSYARALNLIDDPNARADVNQLIAEGLTQHPELEIPLTLMQADWLHSHGFTEAALARLDNSLDAYPDDVGLLYSRALMIGERDPLKMLADLERAHALEPDNGMLQNALGYSLTVHTDQYARAHTLISQALEQHPDDAAVLDSMGWVLYKLGRTQEALAFLRRAHAIFADPEVSAHLIEVLWVSGEQAQALELLQRQRAEHPDNRHLTEVARRLGVSD